ncbi:hypothetical protein [Ruminococcus sp. NK3A76]|uniref:hypothetical protein n=1 Tax=Ruminococcus sp. NK3A76 TaxID=877411 RepID=UPI0004905497|nr:hypothetical protein [Ruminococcus sp. NK3A76]
MEESSSETVKAKEDSVADTSEESSKDSEIDEDDTIVDTSEETSKSEALDVELVESGYCLTTDNDYIEYGVIVNNPDKNNYYEFYIIIVTLYDKDGSVLSTEDQTMGIIAPGEQQAFGSFVETNGEKPKKVEIEIEPGDIVTPSDHIESSEFEISGTRIRTDEFDDI